MAQAQLQVSVNGAPPVRGGVEVPSGATLAFSGVNAAGWERARYEIIDYPEGWGVPAGWSQEADGTIVSTDFIPTTITLPANTVRWGKWYPRLLVNDQIDESKTRLQNGELFDDTCMISMLSPKGQRDVCALEGDHFTTSTTRVKKWARDIQRNLRAIEAVAVGSPAGTTKQLQYNNVSVMGGTAEWTYEGAGRLHATDSGYLTFGAGTHATVGFLRWSYSASTITFIARKDSGGVDRAFLQFTGNTAILGNASFGLNVAGNGFNVTSAATLQLTGTTGYLSWSSAQSGGHIRVVSAVTQIIVAGTKTLLGSSSTDGFLFCDSGYSNAVTNGRIYAATLLDFGIAGVTYNKVDATNGVGIAVGATQNRYSNIATPTYGGGAGVECLGYANVAPTTNPTSSVIRYVDPADGMVKYRRTNGYVLAVDTSPATCGLRLTASSGNPLPTGDVATSTSVYLTPDEHGSIALYDGTTWIRRNTSEVSLALGTLTSGKNYDVFAYCSNASSGTVTLELSAAWSTDTARTDALARQDGIWVKSGTPTRRYVGTIRTISTTQITDTKAQRFVWNMYNRVDRELYIEDTTASWTYNSATFRQVRATASNKVEVICGQPMPFTARAFTLQMGLPAGTGVAMQPGIGIDSTSTNSAKGVAFLPFVTTSPQWNPAMAELDTVLSLGYHAINWLEAAHASTCTGYGTVGANQSHMRARARM